MADTATVTDAAPSPAPPTWEPAPALAAWYERDCFQQLLAAGVLDKHHLAVEVVDGAVPGHPLCDRCADRPALIPGHRIIRRACITRLRQEHGNKAVEALTVREMPQPVLRAYRFALDPRPTVEEAFRRYAGASRWAYNHALDAKKTAREALEQQVEAHRAAGLDSKQAWRKVNSAAQERARPLVAAYEEWAGQVTAALTGAGAPVAAAAKAVKALTRLYTRDDADVVEERDERADRILTAAGLPAGARGGLLPMRGLPKVHAARAVAAGVPTKPDIQHAWVRARGDDRIGEDGCCPWWHGVNSYVFQSAFLDCDTAWATWMGSLAGKRAGRQVGSPRFKKKGRSRDSFRLHHDVKRPGIRFATYRRLNLPSIGEVRVGYRDQGREDARLAKRLVRLVNAGDAVILSVTVSRTGDRWFASVLAKVRQPIAEKPSRRMRKNGDVGIHLGVNVLATLSTGERFANPEHLEAQLYQLKRAQRAYSRTAQGSNRRRKAAQRVAVIHAKVAASRRRATHRLTHHLASTYAGVAIRDLDVLGMAASARGTREKPGRNVRLEAEWNRRLLGANHGELQRQLTYKTFWNGSDLRICAGDEPTSTTCSACGWRNTSLTLADQEWTCVVCGKRWFRGHNAARNILAHAATTAPHGAIPHTEGITARGADVSPEGRKAGRRPAMNRAGPPPSTGGSPRGSNPSAFP